MKIQERKKKKRKYVVIIVTVISTMVVKLSNYGCKGFKSTLTSDTWLLLVYLTESNERTK